MSSNPDRAPAASVTGCPEFDYAPGRPNLYRMMRRKQELVAAHGIDEGFARFRQQCGALAFSTLRRVELESERDVIQRHHLVFRDLGAFGERFEHLPPPVVGRGNHRPLTSITRSQYVACVKDARVVGRSALVEIGGQLLLDIQDDEWTRLDDELEWDPRVFHGDGKCVWSIDGTERGAMKVEEAFTLLGAHTDFFGHWMCEYLPKYGAARLSGVLPDVPVLVDAHMPASHRASLELLYGLSSRVIEVPAFGTVDVERLWCAPALSYQPLHEQRNARFSWDAIAASPARFAPVIRDLQERFDRAAGASTGPRRIYLARRASRHRRLINADEIEAVAREAEFAIIYPEDLSFREQAALARNAAVIVAPEGSALFLSMFARPRTRVCILSHPHTDVLADYNGLLAPHEIRVMAITGPITRANANTPHDSDYCIDASTFRGELRKLE